MLCRGVTSNNAHTLLLLLLPPLGLPLSLAAPLLLLPPPLPGCTDTKVSCNGPMVLRSGKPPEAAPAAPAAAAAGALPAGWATSTACCWAAAWLGAAVPAEPRLAPKVSGGPSAASSVLALCNNEASQASGCDCRRHPEHSSLRTANLCS